MTDSNVFRSFLVLVITLSVLAPGPVVGQFDDPPETRGNAKGLETRLYLSTIAAAEKSLRLNDVREAERWLLEAPNSLRGWEWSHLQTRLDESVEKATITGEAMTDIQTSPNGDYLAVADVSGAIHLIDAETKQVIKQIGDHSEAVYSISFNDDGSRLASVSRDMTARVWEVESGKEVSRIPLDNPGVAATTFSPDGRQVATCTWLMEGEPRSVYGVVWVWDATSGDVHHRHLVGEKPLDSIDWSEDGRTIVVGSWDGLVHVLDDTGKEQQTWKLPDEGIYNAVVCVAVHPDGSIIAAGSKDKTIRIWNRKTGELVQTLRGHRGWVNGLTFSKNGLLACASDDGVVRTWDLAETPVKAQTMLGHTRSVSAITWDPNGGSLYTVSRDQTIRQWQADHSFGGKLDFDAMVEGTYSTEFTPDGKHIYVATYDGDVLVFDAGDGKRIADFDAHGDSSCNMLDIDGSGNLLLTGSWDETGKLWSVPDHKLLHTFNAEQGVYHCNLSPDGSLAALCTGSTVQLWNCHSGEKMGELTGHTGGVREVGFSSDSKQIVTTSADKSVKVWRADSQDLVHTLEQHEQPLHALAFSSDDQWIATGDQSGEVIIWSLADGQVLNRFRCGDRTIQRIDIAPDNRRIAIGGSGLYIADPTIDRPLLEFHPLPEAIWCLQFSPDGMRIASCTTGGKFAICASAGD